MTDQQYDTPALKRSFGLLFTDLPSPFKKKNFLAPVYSSFASR